MPSIETRAQLANLKLDPRRPLVISDVDEVIVHFTRAFEEFLAGCGLWLDAASLALDGNIKHIKGGAPASRDEVMTAVDAFFVAKTRSLEPIDGAIESLKAFNAAGAEVVLLTNLPHASKDDRVVNLRDHGLHFPVITNSGPKGPAIRELASRSAGPVVFVDDSPAFIASAYEFAPDVKLIHFMQDERFARYVEPLPYLSLFTGDWGQARTHIDTILKL